MVTPINPFPVASKFMAAKDVEPQEDVLAQFIIDERRLERRFRNNPRALRYLRQQARIAQVTLAKLLRKEYPQFFGAIPLEQVIDLLDGTLLRNIRQGIRNLRNAIPSTRAPIEDLIDRITTLNGQQLPLETQKLDLEGDLSVASGELATLQTELSTLQGELAGLTQPSTALQTFLNATAGLTNIDVNQSQVSFIANPDVPASAAAVLAYANQDNLVGGAYTTLKAVVAGGDQEAIIAAYNDFKGKYTAYKALWATLKPMLVSTPDIGIVDAANAAVDTALTTATPIMTAYSAKLTAVEDKQEEFDAKDTEVSTIENNIAIVTGQISDLEDKIQAAEQELTQKIKVLAALRQQLRDLREIMRNIGELGEINGILYSFNVDSPPSPPTPEELIPLVQSQITTVENTITTLTAKIPIDQANIDAINVQLSVNSAQLVADLTLFYANNKAAFDTAIDTDIYNFIFDPPVAIFNPLTTPLGPLQAAWSSFKTEMDSLSPVEDMLPLISGLVGALQDMRDYIANDIPNLAPSADIVPILAQVDNLISSFNGVVLNWVTYNTTFALLTSAQAIKAQDQADLAAAGASLLVLQGQLQDLQDSVGQTPPPPPIVFDGIDPDDLALIRGIRDII